MPPRKQPISQDLAKVVEKQLRNWEIERSQKREVPINAEKPVVDFVTISRAVGLPAFKVATLLHEKLGWPVFHRDILQVMAGNDEYRRRLYANMDGRDLSWLEGFVRGLALSRYDRDDYFRRLTQTVLSIARQSHAIFIGRGCNFILPSNVGLKVRLTAPRDYCLDSFARQKGLTPAQAVKQSAEIEDERARYIRKHFYADWEDEVAYDLVVNMARFSIEDAADLTLSALRVRGIIDNGPKRK